MLDPKWLQEIWLRRFDELAIQAERLDEARTLERQLQAAEELLLEALPRERKSLYRDWHDLHTSKSALQKEWLYLKGVQDGMNLLAFLDKSRF
ncbi:hypothetical protein SAMN02799630_05457 [Paenibacillus sp. UNCCL117]|uniref:hypothetical protein n=1 Tax=unclassified Paenibacillus TaxID=185978 RepID=UPI00088E737A|nr:MULTISPECIES: hypothetical protein [unclassified Paenibacillus]SDE46006.1 hypothetical protein SAMN04488602_1299 [Paenibacillus sp. cl123]SFW65956.1 hypothetical protein SAMN02799630_05457 [Paenibacillus sp. UNCCL117]